MEKRVYRPELTIFSENIAPRSILPLKSGFAFAPEFQQFPRSKRPFMINRIHHTAIICADYPASKAFYTGVLGLEIVREIYRAERDSWKLDLALNGEYVLELFSFPSPPPRPSRPEAAGLRHLAFEVDDVSAMIRRVEAMGIEAEAIRVDPTTGKEFTFIADPDGLPIEFYQK